MFFVRPILFFSFLGLAFVFVGCSSSSILSKAGKFYDNDGPPEALHSFATKEHTTLKVEEPYKAATRPYTVMGKRYYPMSGDRSFSQTGVASWYGKQFHGRKTAIGERYDMFAMTAAHPTMELPSYARVTNLSNGKSVIVRVNDRGPFLGGRIIDMSYAAAVKLGYHKAGTARVKVERITRRDIAKGNYSTTPQNASLPITEPIEKQTQIEQTASREESVTGAIKQHDDTPSSIATATPCVPDAPFLSPIPSAESKLPINSSKISDVPKTNESPIIDIGSVQDATEIAEPTPSDAIDAILRESEKKTEHVGPSAPTAITWSVQIGAFSNKINAQEAAAHAEMMLSEHDISARVRVVSDEKLHRVLIGSDSNRHTIQTLCERISSLLGIRSFVIQR